MDIDPRDPLVFLAAFSLLIFVGYVGNLFFSRLRFNDVLLLMGLGVALGPILGWIDPASIQPISAVVGPVALILILFDGGLALKFRDFARGLGPAVALAFLGFALTVGAVAAALVYQTGASWLLAATLGCIVGGTSSVIVMSSLAYVRSTRTTDTALALESALTDILTVVAVFTLVGILLDGTTPSAAGIGTTVALLFGVSIAVGAVAGLLWLLFVPAVRDHPFGYMLTLGVAIALYVGTELLLEDISGGGPLAVLAFGIILGNSASLGAWMKRWVGDGFGAGIKRFQGEIAFLVRTFFFIQLGILVDPSLLTERSTLVVGLGLFAALAVARYLAVAITLGRPLLGTQGWIMWLMMPRGLAAAVMAGVPAALGVAGVEDFVAYAFILVAASNVVTTLGGFLFGGKKPDATSKPIPFAPTRVMAFTVDNVGETRGKGRL